MITLETGKGMPQFFLPTACDEAVERIEERRVK